MILEVKIIEMYLKDKMTSYRFIADALATSMIFVAKTIEEYNNNPYIVRESKLNYLELAFIMDLKQTHTMWNKEQEYLFKKRNS